MIYIWVRETTDWEDERAFRAQLDPRFEPKVEAWNRTFNIPFHVWRGEVKRIAQLNLSRVENSARLGWDEIPEGALVAPLDDDDWFAPDLGKVLEREYDPGASGYHWINGFVQVPTYFGHRIHLIRRRLLGAPAKLTCTTNNYALVKGPGVKDLLSRHVQAGEWFDAQEAGAVRKIERRLSVMNRTLASQTQMGGGRRPYVTRSELIRKFQSYRRLYERPRLPDELAWCRPYVKMMAELVDRLRVKEPSRPT